MPGFSRFVDLALTDEEKLDMAMPMPIPSRDMPEYPCGLRISLSQNELEKLDLEDDMQVGEVIDLRALGTVTSVSSNSGPNGSQCRVEIQLEKISVEVEDDDEGPDEDC